MAPRLFWLAIGCATTVWGEVAYTVPVGAEVLSIQAGSINGPVTTPFALTLRDRAAASGLIRGAVSSVFGNAFTVDGAGWTATALAQPEYPYDIVVLSGAGEGARLRVTANTSDTLETTGRDVSALGVVAGDLIQLQPVDTLDSLFGADTFLGGPDPASADVVTLGEIDRLSFYYNSTNGRWQLTTGATDDQGSRRIPPNGMVAVTRRSGAISLIMVGEVPTTQTNVPVADSGTTYTHAGFPVDVSLGDLALQTRVANWLADASADNADLLAVAAGATWVTYFHNGSHWQRTPGNTADRASVVIPAETPIRIVRRSVSTERTPLIIPLPYSL